MRAAEKSEKPQGVLTVNPGRDKDEGPGSLQPICGSHHKQLNGVLANQTLASLWLPPGNATEQDNRYSAAVQAMMEFKPKDGIEGMMAVQAVGLHSATMECLRRAMIPEQSFEVADRMRRQAANLSRTFLDVLAALDRKRGKGTQVVRVERVQVAAGGQAIVGTVQAGSRMENREGGGHEQGNGGEPHAPAAGRTIPAGAPAGLAHDAAPGAVLPPVYRADAERDAVPVPSHAERKVPDARRRQHRA